jgi:hypothetical protein
MTYCKLNLACLIMVSHIELSCAFPIVTPIDDGDGGDGEEGGPCFLWALAVWIIA